MNDSDIDELVCDSMLALSFRNMTRAAIPVLLVLLIVGYILFISTENSLSVFWVIIAFIFYIVRIPLLHILVKTKRISSHRKLVCLGANNFMMGSVVGATVLFYPWLDLPQFMIISFIILGFAAAGSSSVAVHLPTYYWFIIPLLIPLAVILIVNPGNQLGNVVSVTMSVGIFLLLIVLLNYSRDTYHMFTTYIELSEKNSLMSAELSEALDIAEVEKTRAEASSNAKTRFLAAASHDLRQPVHVVSLYGAALETVIKNTEAREIVIDMNAAIESLSEQLNALLDISKFDAGMVTPIIKNYDLRQIIDRVCSEYEINANEKGIDLKNDVHESFFVSSDQSMLMQILRNIIGNAIKYTEHGSVILSASLDDAFVTLHCRDTGKGISTQDQPYIFEEFYQVENSERDREKGLGLGLSIVGRLTKCLSHKVSLDSEIGVGTCLSLRFTNAVAPISSAFTTKFESEEQEEIHQFNLWVHIVDDEASVRKSMGILLKELGCRVTSSSSSYETATFLETNNPDVVIADLRLKGEDTGIKTLSIVERCSSRIQCVLVTGESSERMHELGISSGVNVLRKPLGKLDVVKVLEKMKTRQEIEA